jgi:hypothetical protein
MPSPPVSDRWRLLRNQLRAMNNEAPFREPRRMPRRRPRDKEGAYVGRSLQPPSRSRIPRKGESTAAPRRQAAQGVGLSSKPMGLLLGVDLQTLRQLGKSLPLASSYTLWADMFTTPFRSITSHSAPNMLTCWHPALPTTSAEYVYSGWPLYVT